MIRLIAAVVLALPLFLSAADAQRPNVVVILADDQGWGDLSVNGNTDAATPRIDSLAKDGALFDRFYVCPVCAPTRAEFFTGRYFARTGVHGVSTGQERLNLDEVTIMQAFKAAGYATGCFGKWHNGSQPPYHPNSRGFDEYYGFTSGHWGSYFDTQMDHNGQLTKGNGFIVDDLTEHAMDFIEKHRDGNFFCYLPVNTPHSPMQVPDKFFAKFANAEIKQRSSQPEQEEIAHTRAALAMCENLDWNVGRVLDKLQELGLAENTIVLYFSDNGPNGWRYNGGMKGRKGSVDEGGVRVPFMIRWPGKITAGAQIKEIAGAIDLFPTLCDLAGVAVPQTKPMDGKSLRPLLLGEKPVWPARDIVSLQAGGKGRNVSVRSQQYRLDPAGALYDMVADPEQKTDVAPQHPDEVQRLKAEAKKFNTEIAPVLEAAKSRPYPVGYAPYTYLPARDGEPHGGIQRSGKAPNCSYFTHWTSLDDSITWDVEPGEAGQYDISVYYTCAQENLGAQIELSFAGQNLRATIIEAHDPPAYGMEHDRDDRGQESYVKDFKPLKLGTISLGKTRAPLTMRALKIPGKAAIEVRYLIVEKH